MLMKDPMVSWQVKIFIMMKMAWGSASYHGTWYYMYRHSFSCFYIYNTSTKMHDVSINSQVSKRYRFED